MVYDSCFTLCIYKLAALLAIMTLHGLTAHQKIVPTLIAYHSMDTCILTFTRVRALLLIGLVH